MKKNPTFFINLKCARCPTVFCQSRSILRIFKIILLRTCYHTWQTKQPDGSWDHMSSKLSFKYYGVWRRFLADCHVFLECSAFRQIYFEYLGCTGHCIRQWWYKKNEVFFPWRQCLWGVVQLWVIHLIKHWVNWGMENKTAYSLLRKSGNVNSFLFI